MRGTPQAWSPALLSARSAVHPPHADSGAPCCANSPAAARSLAPPRPDGPSLVSPPLAPGSTSTAKRPSASPRWVRFTPTRWVSFTPAMTCIDLALADSYGEEEEAVAWLTCIEALFGRHKQVH